MFGQICKGQEAEAEAEANGNIYCACSNICNEHARILCCFMTIVTLKNVSLLLCRSGAIVHKEDPRGARSDSHLGNLPRTTSQYHDQHSHSFLRLPLPSWRLCILPSRSQRSSPQFRLPVVDLILLSLLPLLLLRLLPRRLRLPSLFH
jgi:hypothetical protein